MNAENYQILSYVISIPLILIGLFGIVVPVIPGAVIIWLGMFAFGAINGFIHLKMKFYLIEGALAISAMIVDNLASAWGVRKGGGSKAAAIGAILGTFSVFFLGPWGILIGPALGAAICEIIWAKKNIPDALKTGLWSLWGLLGGIVIKLFIAGIMIGYFLHKIG